MKLVCRSFIQRPDIVWLADVWENDLAEDNLGEIIYFSTTDRFIENYPLTKEEIVQAVKEYVESNAGDYVRLTWDFVDEESGLRGTLYYLKASGTFWGNLWKIPHLIQYAGETLEKAERAFRLSVKRYLQAEEILLNSLQRLSDKNILLALKKESLRKNETVP